MLKEKRFNVSDTTNGVKAFLGGFRAQDLSAKIQECQDGTCSCSCDPQMMKKIQNIEVTSENDGATITITGDVNAHELEPVMKECLF